MKRATCMSTLIALVLFDMVEVASSNLAGPTKHKRAHFKWAFLCLKVYHTLELAEPVDKRDLSSV